MGEYLMTSCAKINSKKHFSIFSLQYVNTGYKRVENSVEDDVMI
jgi:hypothetical protein